MAVISDWIAANNSASLLFVPSAAATRGAPDVHEVVVTAAADIADKSRTKVRLSFVPGGDCDGVVCKEHVTRAVRRRSVRGRGLFVILPINCQAWPP